ncbi:eEF1A lysine and N-terminal methyltransferase [Trifolium repens]|nr:eEF1A lysine and N-terminal methyltransferase [Trifolium repens]
MQNCWHSLESSFKLRERGREGVKRKPGPFTYHCGVFIVAKIRACEWLFFSEKHDEFYARLIMVFLDTGHNG